MTTTTTRSKENVCDFPFFKTPIRTPIRHSMFSSTALDEFAYYSNHLQSTSRTSMHDLQISKDPMATPIRLNKTKFSTPGSIQRRRALGLVNYNHKPICHISSSDDLSTLSSSKELNNKHDEPVVLQAPSSPMICSHPEDDLPHLLKSFHHDKDTFNDLIPADERIEQMVINQINGINMFAFHGALENTIRYQSPQCSRVDISTLLHILN